MKILSIIRLVAFVMIPIAISSCENETLEIQQVYSYKLTYLPIPSDIPENGIVEIRCTLETDGDYENVAYSIRYFQNEGDGALYLGAMPLAVPNDLYPLDQKVFRLYYTAESAENHQFDIYIEDNFGQVEKVSFEFGTQTEVSSLK